jgi:hypothetical protein
MTTNDAKQMTMNDGTQRQMTPDFVHRSYSVGARANDNQ